MNSKQKYITFNLLKNTLTSFNKKDQNTFDEMIKKWNFKVGGGVIILRTMAVIRNQIENELNTIHK